MASGLLQQRLDRLVSDALGRRQFSAIAILTAVIYFFSVFDWSFLFVGNLWRLGHSDIGLNFLGFLYFVRDEWRFPLFQTQTLGYPSGTNIILTDSTPLVSLLFKVVAPLLPSDFHPFGLWTFLCYLLQAHAFSALLFHFGHRHRMAATVGALFAVMTPFFAVLLVISSLSAQFLILYAILLYFRIADSSNPRRPLALFTLLLVVALLINFYLFAMTFVVYGCALTNVVFCRSQPWRGIGINLLTTFAALVVTMGVSGYLPRPIPWAASSGFGYFSMNLLAPVTPARPAPDGPLFYMNLAMQPDATGGQHAGFNYWGFGVLLLVGISLLVWFRRTRALLHPRWWPLALGLLVLTVFAVSNRVYFGHDLLFSYSLPGPLLSVANQFHSGGRFFWVVSYVVMPLAVSGGLSLRPRWVASAVVIAAVAVQLADTRSIRDSMRRVVRMAETQSITEERWRPIVAKHQLVALLPPSQCEGFFDLYSEIGGIAARSGVAFHSVRAGRYGTAAPESCRALYREVLRQGFQPGTLYLLDRGSMLSVAQRPDLRNSCSRLEDQGLCTLQRVELGLPPLPADAGAPVPWPPKQGPLNPVEFAPLLGIGWSKAEEGGVWSLGDRSELLFRLASCAGGASLRVKILPFVGQEEQVVTAQANQGVPVSRRYRERSIDTLVIPIGNCDPSDPRVIVSFSVEKPLSPLEVGESGDTRPLGVLLIEAELLRRPG